MYFRLIIHSVKSEMNSFPEIQMRIFGDEVAYTLDFEGFKAFEVGLAAFPYLLEIAKKDLVTFKWSEGRGPNDLSLDRPIGPIQVITKASLGGS